MFLWDWVLDEVNQVSDVYVRDTHPVISDDGSVAAIDRRQSGAITVDPNNPTAEWVDLLVPQKPTASAFQPSLSSDGRYVAITFPTRGDDPPPLNPIPGVPPLYNEISDVYLVDRLKGTQVQFMAFVDGIDRLVGFEHLVIAGNGQSVVYALNTPDNGDGFLLRRRGCNGLYRYDGTSPIAQRLPTQDIVVDERFELRVLDISYDGSLVNIQYVAAVPAFFPAGFRR